MIWDSSMYGPCWALGKQPMKGSREAARGARHAQRAGTVVDVQCANASIQLRLWETPTPCVEPILVSALLAKLLRSVLLYDGYTCNVLQHLVPNLSFPIGEPFLFRIM